MGLLSDTDKQQYINIKYIDVRCHGKNSEKSIPHVPLFSDCSRTISLCKC
jgi:hypothetical protein